VTLITELNEQDVLDISAALGEPDLLRDRRLQGFKALSDLAWPTPRDEDWRHTNPRRIALDRPMPRGSLDAQGATAVAPPEGGIVAAVGDALGAHARVVDGAFAGVELSAAAAEAGVVVTDLATAAAEHPELVREHLGAIVEPDEVFAAANLAGFTAGVFVYVPDDVELEAPLAVTVQVTTAGTVLPRVLAVLGARSKARLYVNHAGSAEASVVEVVELAVGEGASLETVSSQDWGPGVAHVANHRASVGRDAMYQSLEVTLGGDTVYVRPNVGLDGVGASGELLGVYFGSEGQQFEHRSQIHHNASHTQSVSVYKGALQGRSRATWFGNIRIEKHAKATVSDETNRNLILTEGAKADSIPFLEIETADVLSCGHHSSVGQVDELQLFYLESRGIPREEAARLLVYGFFAEVLGSVDLPGVSDTVLAEIEEEVRAAPTTVMDQRRR
jgi:Fe-S cluster assembly protein SufD